MAFVRNRCPKCGAVMMNDCCVGCGFMSNGNYTGKITIDKFSDLKLYDDHFDDLTMNRKLFLVFLLESLYFCYRGHLLFGCFVGFVDMFISYGFISVVSNIFGNFFPLLVNFSLIAYFIVKKILYVMFANTICLSLDKLRVDRIKKRFNNYQAILCKHNDCDWFKVIICLVIYYVVLFLFLFYKWKINGIL